MKLLVLSLCFVAVLATVSAESERHQELQNTLDELSKELEEADIAETNYEGLRIYTH